jgi:hypothetical protein
VAVGVAVVSTCEMSSSTAVNNQFACLLLDGALCLKQAHR